MRAVARLLNIGLLLAVPMLSVAAEPAAPAAAAAPVSETTLISQPELKARMARKDPAVAVIDVRTAEEFAAGHIPGARNVPLDQLPEELGKLSALREKDVVLYCRSGRRSLLAAQTLKNAGFSQLLHLEGDFLAWEAAHQPIEK